MGTEQDSTKFVKKIKEKIIPIYHKTILNGFEIPKKSFRDFLRIKKSRITKAGIFGSYARGEQKKESDVDILINIPENYSLLDVVRLKRIIEESIKKKVDLIEYCGIRPMIKAQALKEEVRII